MLCAFPKSYGHKSFACNKCENCKINKKRFWTGRILLEATHAPLSSSFVTLTYNPEHLPENGSLSLRDAQNYIKRLRNGPMGAVRYFLVGEYGGDTGRAHYHLAIFNQPPDKYESYFREKWVDADGQPMGFVQTGDITAASAAYIAHYTTKKMNDMHQIREDGRTPEFATMSKSPPLGAAGIRHILDLLHTKTGAAGLAKMGDVPTSFRMNGKEWPIGLYWRNYLREELGIEPQVTPPWEIDLQKLMRENQYDQAKARKQHDKIWANRKSNTEHRRYL